MLVATKYVYVIMGRDGGRGGVSYADTAWNFTAPQGIRAVGPRHTIIIIGICGLFSRLKERIYQTHLEKCKATLMLPPTDNVPPLDIYMFREFYAIFYLR